MSLRKLVIDNNSMLPIKVFVHLNGNIEHRLNHFFYLNDNIDILRILLINLYNEIPGLSRSGSVGSIFGRLGGDLKPDSGVSISSRIHVVNFGADSVAWMSSHEFFVWRP
jgi:hypothetical protein